MSNRSWTPRAGSVRTGIASPLPKIIFLFVSICRQVRLAHVTYFELLSYSCIFFFSLRLHSRSFALFCELHLVFIGFGFYGALQCDNAGNAKNINNIQVKSTDSRNKSDGRQQNQKQQKSKSDRKFNGMQNISIRVEREQTANAPDLHHDPSNHHRPPHLFSTANTT